jgi:hypothetical protein
MSVVAELNALHKGRLHPYVAAIFASASGLLMVGAGVAFSQRGWGSARPFALAGGMAIQLALFTERRGVRARGADGSNAGRTVALQLGASGLILTAGMGLVWAGHRASTTGWWPLALTLVPLVLLLVPAAILNRRAAAARIVARSMGNRRRH